MGSPPYTKDTLTALGAQRRALEIVFGPITFQVARIMRKIGMLDLLAIPEHRAGKSLEEISRALCRPRYAVQILVESALSGGILYRCLGEAGEPERYCLTKAGFMLNRDAMTRVLTDFVHDVCYQGMFELERALFQKWGVSFFYDAGNAFDSSNDFKIFQGVGIGLHYYTPIGAINLGLARQIGVAEPDFRVHFTIGFQL